MAAGSIVVDLLMRTGSFETDTARAARVAKRAAKDIDNSFADLNKTIGRFTNIFAGAFTVRALTQAIATTIDGVDAMNDLADATGASIENISALDDVARRTGTNLDNVSGILVKFNMALKDADPNKGAGAVLKALNLDIAELKKLDPAEALRRTAVALSGFADDGNKARAVQELFGKSIKDAAPFLKDLAEQGQLNATVTKQQAEEYERFNKQIFSVQADINKLARTFVSDLIPAISAVIRELTAGREAFGGFWAAALNIGTSRTFDTNLDGLQFYRKELERVEKAQAALSNETSPFFKGFGEQNLGAEAEKLRKFVDYYEKLVGVNKGAAGGGRGFVNPALGDPKSLDVPPDVKKVPKAKKDIDEVAKALEKLELELATFGQDDAFKKAFELEGLGATNAQLEHYKKNLAELKRLKTHEEIQEVIKALEKQRNEFGLSADQLAIQELLLKGASQAQIEYAQSVIATTQALKDNKAIAEAKAAADEYLESIRRAQSAELQGFGKGNKERQRIGGRLGIEDKFEQQRRDLNRSRIDASLSGDFGPEQQRRYEQELEIIRSTQQQALEIYDNTFQKRLEMEADWSNGASEAAANYLDSIKDVSSQVNDAFTSAFQGMEDALVKFITTGKLDFKSLADSILVDITRIIIKQTIMNSLMNALGLGGGAGGGFFSSLFGGGGGFSNNGVPVTFGGGRAGGGDVMSGRSYLLGEQGPEMFVPRTAGTILNAKETARMGSSMTSVTIHQHFVGQQSRQTMDQGAASAGRVVNRAVSRATA
jgi:lambda family phage tail tape measure protein